MDIPGELLTDQELFDLNQSVSTLKIYHVIVLEIANKKNSFLLPTLALYVQ
jgi:hypothetical protein